MDTMKAICSRKSVRSYNGKQVTDDELRQLLRAAQAAPVGMGAYDSVMLTVVTNRAFLERINAATVAMSGRKGTVPLYNAPMLVVVSSKLARDGKDNVAYSSCACVVQNIALEAVELGIGVCHIWGAIRGLNTDPALVAELNLPEGFVPVCAAALGHTDETYEPREIPEGRMRIAYLHE